MEQFSLIPEQIILMKLFFLLNPYSVVKCSPELMTPLSWFLMNSSKISVRGLNLSCLTLNCW